MEQGAQVRVTGPSRVLLALSTGALVGVTSVATAIVVLSGTAGVAPGQLLEPRPPAAAAPGQPPVVVLPPGALGTGSPPPATSSRRASDSVAAPRRAGTSSPSLSLAPELSAPVQVPADALLPPLSQPPLAEPALPLPAGDDAVVRPGKRRGASKDEPVRAATLEDEVTSDAPADSLSGTTSLLLVGSDEDATKRDADEAKRERRAFAAQERGRRAAPDAARVIPAVPAVPAVPGVAPAVPATPASPAAVERQRARKGAGKAAGKGAGKAAGKPAATSSSRAQGSAAKGERTKKTSANNKKKASGSSSGRRAPQGGRGSGRGPRS